MAFLAQKIGSFEFLSLRGVVMPPRLQIDRPMMRPGVDGVGLWKTGSRGQPFELRSAVDVATVSAGRTLFQSYYQAIGDNPVDLVVDGYNFAAEFWRVAILDVRASQVKGIINSAGGTLTNPLAKLVASWTLIGVVFTPEVP